MFGELLSWMTDWASKFVVWNPSAEEIGKVVAACAALMTLIQAVKRLIEWVEKNPVLAKLLPKELRESLGFLAHGWGARVLAALVTLVTILPTVLAEGLTVAEVVNMVVALLGAMGLYELVRGRVGLLFPKRNK